MKSERLSRYCLLACIGVFAASLYPLFMGASVVRDMLADGTVQKENYPKYIIPYTPIAAALIVGVLLMPLLIRLLRRFALPVGSAFSLGVFFAAETLLERNVVVSTESSAATLEDWQMYMCYVSPEVFEHKTQTPVDILMGNYSPAFKLHFYMISVLLILSILGSLYGFAQMISTGSRKRLKALVLQSVASALFLALCILACFTAFWRDGSLQVSPLSAALMAAFFILMGVTFGLYIGSFLLGKRRAVAVAVPAAAAAVMTALMYVGEMILLGGHLYSLGSGVLFEGLPGIVLAPADIAVILSASGVTAPVFALLARAEHRPEPIEAG